MKKRFVSLLLAISMILSLMPVSAVTAFAEDESSGAVTTVDSGFCGADNGGENLSWTLDNNGVLTISGSGAMKDYTWYESQHPDWYKNHKDSIRSVVLDNNITHIGDYAFDGCTNIKSVRYTGYNNGDAGIALPESVKTIGKYAFSRTGVTGTLELPKNLTAIGADAFFECRKLNGELIIPKNITAIDEGVFERCGFTGNLDIPNNVTKIGSCAFQGTYNNTGKLILPNGLTEIGYEAFYDSHFQGDLTIPDSVTTLAKRAFEYGSFSGKLTISNNLKTLGTWTFHNCSGFYGDLVIPASVTTIGQEVFLGSYYGNITGEKGRLIFADGSQLTEIGEGAFRECPNLTGELKLPGTVKKIGRLAFRDSYGFTGKLELPAHLEELGGGAFENCSKLTGKLTFPSNVSEIDNSVFQGTGITEVVIPSSIKAVYNEAFWYCSNLKKVYLPTEIPKIYNRAFRGCDNVKFYYPGYKTDWETQTNNLIESNLNPGKDAVKPHDVGTWRPICYYVNVTFDAGSGMFQDGKPQHIVNGKENELYRTENLTEAMVTAIGTPKQSGYHFAGWSLSPNGSVDDVLPVKNGYMTIDNNGMNEFGGVEDGMTLYAVYTSAASVKINDIAAGEEIKAGKEHEFTLTGEENTDTGATVTLALNDSTNAKLEYYNSTTDEWQEVTDAFKVRDVRNMKFRIAVPKNAGDATVTLTAVVKDANGNEIEDGGDSKTFKVNKYVNAKVTITGLDHTTVKAGEAKEFTVNATPNDDTIDKVTFVTTSGEVQWSNDSGHTWTPVSGDVAYSDLTGKQFRVVPAADAANGTVTVTVIAKKADGTEAAKKDASFTVTKKEEPVIPGGGSTGGGENPGENPGGNPGSGSTKPEQETPKRKLEIADGTLTSVMVKDENGNLKDITDTITKDSDGKYEIPVGAKVTITAKDAPEGMKFGEWSISDKTLLGDPDVPYTEKDLIFTMPDNPDGVKLSVVYLEESIGEEPNLLEKGALAGTVVVGSAALLYQGHMLGTELYLRYLLPHGAVIPQNRAELAVLLWQDAENPEPVSTTLYSDISDEDSAIQQAARWAVENDLMEQLDAEEHPDHFDPFVPVTFSDSIRAWKKAQELKKSVH